MRNEHYSAQILHLHSLNDVKRAMTKANPPCRGRSSVGRKLYVLQEDTFKGRTGGSGNRKVEEDYQPMGDDDGDPTLRQLLLARSMNLTTLSNIRGNL